jgi:type II secretory pathway component GspD/PulD (secretin)
MAGDSFMKMIYVTTLILIAFSTVTAEQNFKDDAAIHRYLETVFHDKSLSGSVTVHAKPCTIQDVIELVGLSTGINFFVDAEVAGASGKINVKNKKAGEVLSLLCNRNDPRLALMQESGMWRIMVYDKAFSLLKNKQSLPALQKKIFYLKHVHCDDLFRTKLEDMWRLIAGNNDASYCSLDAMSKKVFVYGTKDAIQEVGNFLKEVDCPVPQVRIDAIVAEVDSKYENQLGFNWSGFYNRKASAKDFKLLSAGQKDGDHFALNLFARATSPVRIPFLIGGPDLNLRRIVAELRAAETESKAKILLKPSVLTGHEEKAEILIGKSVPIKTVVEDFVEGKARNIQTIQYKDIGTILNVRPLVNPDKKSVLLDIWVEDSSIVDPSAGYDAPVIKTIRTKNRVTLKSGQTTAIGGLMLNHDESNGSAMPVLSHLPLIGRLFQNKQHINENNQLLIFITPTIELS